jgi:hypothetical protein
MPGGQNALECSEMHYLKLHFAHQAQLNAHVRPIETKMAVGRENDKPHIPFRSVHEEWPWLETVHMFQNFDCSKRNMSHLRNHSPLECWMKGWKETRATVRTRQHSPILAYKALTSIPLRYVP